MPSLQFKGKAFVQNHHLVVPFHELTPVKAKGTSKTASLHDNLIVEGDNLKALKALLPTYHGKVKCIYIDPPYNTGNEGWAYNDAVNSPMMQDWLGKTVDREDLTRHDKWCCMMLPRLRLLREFLTDDGAIFVSIDDNEVHRLRCLMDEVFGEENFVAEVAVLRNPKGGVMADGFAQNHEYLVVYTRSVDERDFSKAKSSEEIVAQYDEKDEGGRFRTLELRNTHREFGKQNRPNLYFPLFIDPKSGDVFSDAGKGRVKVLPDWEDGFEGCWTWGEERASKDRSLLVGRLSGGKWKVFRKAYAVGARKKPTTVWQGPEFHTEKGQQLIDEILGSRKFYAPKPLGFLKEVLSYAMGPNDIVLDAFGGSATTAHAVLALNKQDAGSRRFVLIEAEDYADSITAERVRRVAKGVPGAKDEALKAGLGGTFSYFKLGRPMQMSAILDGSTLPDFESLARYVFFTATGEEFDAKKLNRKTGFIGTSRHHDVFLLYTENAEKLKQLALTLDAARALPSVSGKPKLVFAPTKYLDESFLDRLRITFCQLPFQIYKALDA